MFFDFVHRLMFLKSTFQKLDLFLSSGKIMVAPTLLGPLERAILNHWIILYGHIIRLNKDNIPKALLNTKAKGKCPMSHACHMLFPTQELCFHYPNM
jgi:hypothetical protein